MIEYFLVGGAVRDEIMGKKSKDLDYTCEAPSYNAMRADILAKGGTIFLEKPEFQTIRARLGKESADFVLARREGAYSDGRHPDRVEPGTILDDLARRDFSINAIAKKDDGTYIDPFDGIGDIQRRIIKCVGNPQDRFREDSLRMLRAIRFAITKDFIIDKSVCAVLRDVNAVDGLRTISGDRVREELGKCFKFNTLETLRLLESFWQIRDVVFTCFGNLWLRPTVEE